MRQRAVIQKLFQFTLLVTLGFTIPAAHGAEGASDNARKSGLSAGPTVGLPPAEVELDGNLGLVDQVVSVPFEPTNVSVLVERNLGQVNRYDAALLRTSGAGVTILGHDEVLVGAKVPLESPTSQRQSFHFVFFLADTVGSFAATPVNHWTRKMLKDNTKGSRQLEKEFEGIKRQAQVKEIELSELEGKLKVLRNRASSVAGIDQIVDLKIELEHLKGLGQDNRAEMARLRELIDTSRKLTEVPEVTERRRDLLVHLQEAAQATAMTDRLNNRRRDAALATVQKKLTAIKATKSIDASALAQEVLRLRGQRKSLEAKLNVAGPERSNEF